MHPASIEDQVIHRRTGGTPSWQIFTEMVAASPASLPHIVSALTGEEADEAIRAELVHQLVVGLLLNGKAGELQTLGPALATVVPEITYTALGLRGYAPLKGSEAIELSFKGFTVLARYCGQAAGPIYCACKRGDRHIHCYLLDPDAPGAMIDVTRPIASLLGLPFLGPGAPALLITAEEDHATIDPLSKLQELIDSILTPRLRVTPIFQA